MNENNNNCNNNESNNNFESMNENNNVESNNENNNVESNNENNNVESNNENNNVESNNENNNVESNNENNNNYIRHNVLLSLRDVNQNDKENSSDNLTNSIQDISQLNSLISFNNSVRLPLCSTSTQNNVERQQRISARNVDRNNSEQENLDLNVPSSEIRETEIKRENLEIAAHLNENTHRAIQADLGNQNDINSQLIRQRNILMEQNEELTEKHLKNVKDGLALDQELAESSNRLGSIIDDYADVSSEMPDYSNED